MTDVTSSRGMTDSKGRLHSMYTGAIAPGLLLSLVLVLSAGGCSDAPERRELDDPAMRTPAPADAAAITPAADTADAADAQAQTTAAVPHFDETRERIFIPNMGWMPAAEFWDIYENDPARLPEDLDFHAVHLLREATPTNNG